MLQSKFIIAELSAKGRELFDADDVAFSGALEAFREASKNEDLIRADLYGGLICEEQSGFLLQLIFDWHLDFDIAPSRVSLCFVFTGDYLGPSTAV